MYNYNFKIDTEYSYKCIKVIVDIILIYKRFIIFQSLYCLNTPQNVDAHYSIAYWNKVLCMNI